MAQELAHRSMLIHKLMDTVKVTTKTLFEDTHHQDPPQLHPRTPHVAIGARQNVLLQQREELLAGLLMRIQMLETKENGWNVIAGFMIQLDVLDPCLTECELRFPCLSHWCPSCEDCRQWADWGGNSCINYLTSKFFAILNRHLFFGFR